MRIAYDRSADSAYIYITDRIQRGEVSYTYACDPEAISGQIHLDLDGDGRLVGLEVLDASRLLARGALRSPREG